MNRDSESSGRLEKELFAAFSTLAEIDIGEGRRREILHNAGLPRARAGRRALKRAMLAFAACLAFALAFHWRNLQTDSDFRLDDIKIANEPAAGQSPTCADSLWQRSVDFDGDLGLQEEYALACVMADFSEAPPPPGEPLRKVRECEVRVLLVFVK